MGATSVQALQERAYRGIAQSYGPPLAGKTQSLTLTAADQTVTLEGPATYLLGCDQPFFIGQQDATVAGNRARVPANVEHLLATPVGGLTLHVVQAGTAGAFSAAKLDDVG
jgi:hypothetical protein